jgi:2-keto-4-pentenoate hydratase/2-oxohepta-3-ene-1,7-dioic acid hydratase in catechol pathway
MTIWIRFERGNDIGFGTLENGQVQVHRGDLFGSNEPSGETLPLNSVDLVTPCTPSKMLALWNNFHATMEKTGLPKPEHPWYFVKTANTFAPDGADIRRPAACNGKVLFEGELGIVIGKPCKEISAEEADDHIFGYTCINDVTAFEHLFSEEKFAHWTRAKCFDGFGVFGPGITTGVNPDGLVIKTFLEGDDQVQERQNYPVSDMIYGPREIVSRLSHDMTLFPGDIIACGTSVGAGAMKDGWTVRIVIEGVGELVNRYDAS